MLSVLLLIRSSRSAGSSQDYSGVWTHSVGFSQLQELSGGRTFNYGHIRHRYLLQGLSSLRDFLRTSRGLDPLSGFFLTVMSVKASNVQSSHYSHAMLFVTSWGMFGYKAKLPVMNNGIRKILTPVKHGFKGISGA